ncbi:hypothetical protein SDC9_191062 [bioreactor metagenome]|uniref:Uncharacterized protein n=1 Tax=bioreactor metagenome TaxID=1076179 RepID=A0A645HYD0_9ZZZZ|nr:hypothetical protein [Syntrophomonadaceae bacterium]
MLFNEAISRLITIPSSENNFILAFDKTVYNLSFDFFANEDVYIDINTFNIKINEGDSLKLHHFGTRPICLKNVEVYKIEFIKQDDVGVDVDIYYQGFIQN